MPESAAKETWRVGRLLATTTAFLRDKGSATPRLDAELLLSRVLKMTKVQLYVNFERDLGDGELGDYRELVRRRARHEPVAYILGSREFYGLELKTTPAALIPRPETEHLVDEALRLARDLWPGEAVAAADIGCGTGAIALALAKNLKPAEVAAVDLSPDALNLARENAAALHLADRVTFHQGDLLAPLAGQDFHLVCANLPYIPTAEMAGLMPDVGQHEPRQALDGGPAGLTPIIRLLETVAAHLRPQGRVLLEIWPDSLPRLLAEADRLALIPDGEVIRDLAGHARVVVFRQAGE